ncbi:ornithine carbamoyltransferase [bacterium]|nr:ornithine carbamoyltransferase [bacterium]
MKKDFLEITDFTTEELWETLELAKKIKAEVKSGKFIPRLADKTMSMVFAKPSARTRVSFEIGMVQLGGYALYLSPNDIGIGKREAVKDIARVLSGYNDIIMARLFDHKHMEEMAKYATVPVINGLTDYNHPCQVMADIMTVWEHRGNLDNLKVVFVGDGNNVANSWINLACRLPMHFVISTPCGYEPEQWLLDKAKNAGLSTVEAIADPLEAVKNADVIYADVWTSMGQEEEKAKRLSDFAEFQINAEMLSHAKPDCKIMHCLPAHRGEEITDEVLDGPNSIVFDEAENRMHAQKAIISFLFGITK